MSGSYRVSRWQGWSKSTTGAETGMSRKGGERAYKGCFGKDRSPHHIRHSIASMEYAPPPGARIHPSPFGRSKVGKRVELRIKIGFTGLDHDLARKLRQYLIDWKSDGISPPPHGDHRSPPPNISAH